MNELTLTFTDTMSIPELHEHCKDEDLTVSIFAGGELDSAIIGLALQGTHHVAVYSLDLLIQALMTHNEWSEEDALEWYGFNMTGHHEACPVVIHTGIYREEVTGHGTG